MPLRLCRPWRLWHPDQSLLSLQHCPCPLRCQPHMIRPETLPCIGDMLDSSWWARGRYSRSRKCAGMALHVNVCRACTHQGRWSTSSDWSSGCSHSPPFPHLPQHPLLWVGKHCTVPDPNRAIGEGHCNYSSHGSPHHRHDLLLQCHAD